MNTPSLHVQSPLLEIRDVVTQYNNTTVLNGLNLAVQPGEIYALLGANGAGKTTTLNLLLGFIKPSSGQVRVNGIDPVSNPTEARVHMAYIPENIAFYDHLSASENIAYLMSLTGKYVDSQSISKALSTAGLEKIAHNRHILGFSKGMRQKVAIALALVRTVPVLLLDEPTSGLDPQASVGFNSLLSTLCDQGISVLMVTHDLLGAANIANRIGFLREGRLAEQVTSNPNSDRFNVQHLYNYYLNLKA